MVYCICDRSLCFRLQTLCAEADPPCSSVEAQSFAWYTSKKASNAELLCIRCSLSHPSALTQTRLEDAAYYCLTETDSKSTAFQRWNVENRSKIPKMFEWAFLLIKISLKYLMNMAILGLTMYQTENMNGTLWQSSGNPTEVQTKIPCWGIETVGDHFSISPCSFLSWDKQF